MGGIQSGVSPNFTELYNEQSQHVAYIVDQGLSAGATVVEPTEQAETDWVRLIMESAYRRAGFLESCTPGYYNNEGKPDDGPGLVRRHLRRRCPGVFQAAQSLA